MDEEEGAETLRSSVFCSITDKPRKSGRIRNCVWDMWIVSRSLCWRSYGEEQSMSDCCSAAIAAVSNERRGNISSTAAQWYQGDHWRINSRKISKDGNWRHSHQDDRPKNAASLQNALQSTARNMAGSDAVNSMCSFPDLWANGAPPGTVPQILQLPDGDLRSQRHIRALPTTLSTYWHHRLNNISYLWMVLLNWRRCSRLTSSTRKRMVFGLWRTKRKPTIDWR